MRNYNYHFKHESGKEITVWFNYITPDRDEVSSFIPGVEYCAWVLWEDDTEAHPECEYFVSEALTDEEKQLFARNYFKKLFVYGWVMSDFS